MKTLTILEYSSDADFSQAKRICADQGYSGSFAYTTSSDIPGMYCLPSRAGQPEKVVCKTKEFGFVVLQVIEE